jgi:hypothetical protein
MPRIGKLSRPKTLHTARARQVQPDPGHLWTRMARAAARQRPIRPINLGPSHCCRRQKQLPLKRTRRPSRSAYTRADGGQRHVPRKCKPHPGDTSTDSPPPNTSENQPIIRPGADGALVLWPPAGRREPPPGPTRPRCGRNDRDRAPPVGRRRRRSETSHSTRPHKRPICQRRATTEKDSAKPPLRHRGQCSAQSTLGRTYRFRELRTKHPTW